MNSSSPQPLDSRQLRAFVTLARTASFTLAAKELFLSQSAVSHSMKALEQEVGCRLFDRMSKKITLTQAGEHLLQYAERILTEMRTARESLVQLGHWGRTPLRLAATATICQYQLPRVLREFRREYPDSLVTVETLSVEKAWEAVKDHRVDLAMSLRPRHAEALVFEPWFTDELVFVVPPSHPWAKQGRVDWSTVPRQPCLLYPGGSTTGQLIKQHFAREKIDLHIVVEVGCMTALKAMVKAGLGTSILPSWILHQEREENALVSFPLGRRKLKREWGVVHRPGRRLSLPQETLLKCCRKTIGPSGGD